MPHAWRARIAGATRFTLGAADYGKRTYVRLPCTAWNLGGRPSCTPTSMPSTRSVEQLLDPSLRNRPIAVGGSVVLAASYEARSYGVRGGMPGWQARQLCGDLLFVGGHFERYQQFGDDVVSVFADFTPRVERISIDEAFLDVAGATRLFGPPNEVAAAIRRRVRHEIGLPLSIGVARTKHLAKVASQVAKPDGLVTVAPEDESDFLEPLPIGLLWGVGPTTERRLHSAGIYTIGQLAEVGNPILGRLLGQGAGTKLAALSVNVDPRAVETRGGAKSMGAQAALGRREATPELIRETLAYLTDRVAGRLRKANLAGRRITVRVRFPQMRSATALGHTAGCDIDHPDADRGRRKAGLLSHRRKRPRTSHHAPCRFSLFLTPRTCPPTRAPAPSLRC